MVNREQLERMKQELQVMKNDQIFRDVTKYTTEKRRFIFLSLQDFYNRYKLLLGIDDLTKGYTEVQLSSLEHFKGKTPKGRADIIRTSNALLNKYSSLIIKLEEICDER